MRFFSSVSALRTGLEPRRASDANITELLPSCADVPHRLAGLGAQQFRGLTFWQERSPGFVLMVVDAPSTDCASMDWADYLRDQAIMYRQLAEQTDDPGVQNDMVELASVGEEVANNMEDHLTGG
jgi:hypothetical protein